MFKQAKIRSSSNNPSENLRVFFMVSLKDDAAGKSLQFATPVAAGVQKPLKRQGLRLRRGDKAAHHVIFYECVQLYLVSI